VTGAERAEHLCEKLRAMHDESVLALIELEESDSGFIPCTRPFVVADRTRRYLTD
jgi:hypothetical protein